MPAVTSGKVLVTGASGFLAQWTVQRLLQQGFAVRGTVRSETKGNSLKEFFASFGDKFEFVIVLDMTQSGSFDEAVKGVDAVLHIAAFISFTADDPDEVIRPALGGAKSILESTLHHGDSVKRLVVTSSYATVYSPPSEFRVFDENDWNEATLKEVEAKGRNADQISKYRASKILAERAVWDFAEKQKDRKFDIVVLNPPWILGPALRITARTIEELKGSTRFWIDYIRGAKSDSDYLLTDGEWIDVRDLSEAHVLALKNPDVAEQRIIVSGGPFKFQEWVNVAHTIDNTLPIGNPSLVDPNNPNYKYRFDVSKAAKYFAIQYTSKEQATKDMLAQFKRHGLI